MGNPGGASGEYRSSHAAADDLAAAGESLSQTGMEVVRPEIFASHAARTLPRYTSYPTAPHFHAGVDAPVYEEWLGGIAAGTDVSLYLHVPFCRAMCWYCGCHTTITARDEPITRYLAAVEQEIEHVAGLLPARMGARHIHFGGGTPTLIPPARFAALMAVLRSAFDVRPASEIAIEIDPRTLEPGMADALARAGVNRASLGVQSFDPIVQRAINRVQSFEKTASAIGALRAAGIEAINLDLVYGLPHQDVASCQATVAQAVLLMPDRLAVFGYAHVPEFKRHQRKIDDAALADAAGRQAQAEAIAAALIEAGYVRIGLDHYARPGDPLAEAHSRGSLRRNFQGYTIDGCEVLIGFGASSIGRLPQGHVQNAVLIGDYQRRVAAGGPAVAKGCRVSARDRLRGAVIERIMCDFEVDLESICARHGADADELARDAPMLDRLVAEGIVRRRGPRLVLDESARPLVRAFAAAFDDYLGRAPVRHSKAV